MDKGLVRWAKTAGKSRQGQSVTASRQLNGLREGKTLGIYPNRLKVKVGANGT